jgi:hypothetical protein
VSDRIRESDEMKIPASISVICVYNDPEVLHSCLGASIAAGLAAAPRTEFLPIDNRNHVFSSAGAALNHGARLASNDVVVLVHQDVVLHSLTALEHAASVLVANPAIGVMGASGVDGRGRILGRVRDRVVVIGDSAPDPRNVESLDEVLFMMTREELLRHPLSEDPLLAWHAYGVEYSLRIRRSGRRAVAFDVPLTHNSLSTNLDRLDLAHRKVGDDYPEFLPIHTTCGTVHREDRVSRLLRFTRRIRGAAIWWGESLTARELTRQSRVPDVVLADIRVLIDKAAELGSMDSITVYDVSPDPIPGAAGGLTRFGRRFSIKPVPLESVKVTLSARDKTELILVVGLTPRDVGRLADSAAPAIVGHSRDTGLWMVVGLSESTAASLWSGIRNRPIPVISRVGIRP